MNQDKNNCIEPDLYTSHAAGSSLEETRAVLLGNYAGKELDPKLETILREHLTRCACCSEFVSQLQELEQFRANDMSVVHASCPPSLNMDRFLFQPEELLGGEKERISQHLKECPLCKEETDWLKNLEQPKTIPFSPPRMNWLQYASVAAALFFMTLSIILFWQRASVQQTENRLRALAVIKEPDQINYVDLKNLSVSLPEKMEILYDHGVKALQQQRFQEAIRNFELVATAHPDHSAAIYLLGYSYYQMNEPEKAFALCDRAEKIIPHSMERCLSLVHIALKTGNFGRAVQEINGLHHEAPNHPEVKALYDQITSVTRGKILKL
ncbi:tetratricopeptide repeat protein [bacterium]|nr:tetratricopeptide repeat protein [bacterium]